MPVILAAAVIVILTLVYIHFTKYNDDWIEKNIAGPEPTFLFGNVEDAVLRRKHIGVVFKNIYDAFPKEKILGIFVMRNPEVLVRDLDVVKKILIEDSDNFIDPSVQVEKSDHGDLFYANDTRKLFPSEMLPNLMHHINENGDAFVEYVDRITKLNQEQDIYDLIEKYTEAVVAACVFGVNLNSFNEEYDMLLSDRKTQNFGRELEMMYPGILNKIDQSLPNNMLIKRFIAKSELNNGKEFVNFICKWKKEAYSSQSKKRGNSESLLFSDEDITTKTRFITATYEISTPTVAFSLYQLALNPDIQENVVAEIKGMLNEQNGDINLKGILDLSYMGKVFDETLRMYPVISDIKRKSKKAYKIPGTKITIEKDQLIRISVLGIHYDEKIYPKSEVFDPERFAPENVETRHECSCFPFDLGSRHCTDVSFAQVLSRVCILKLLSQFRLVPSENTPTQVQFEPSYPVLRPRRSLLMKIVRRQT